MSSFQAFLRSATPPMGAYGKTSPGFMLSANWAFMAGMYMAVPFSSATPMVALYFVAFAFASDDWTMIPLGTYILLP